MSLIEARPKAFWYRAVLIGEQVLAPETDTDLPVLVDMLEEVVVEDVV